ncbi:MAG: hypothetical protein J1F33_04510 [Clostridiales bacterium]|nr:hypothetical protein [Clostridiales bacterium]
MKGKSVILAIFIAVISILCGCRPPEDMIPKEFGKPEGLWIYKSNERMRTDGSEREAMFSEIELDGETVTEFEVDAYSYCVEEDKVFFSIMYEKGYCLYLFDYIDKRGEVLWSDEYRFSFCPSDEFMYVETVDSARLYLRDGTLVSTEIENGFSACDTVLCRVDGTELIWLRKDGRHSAKLSPDALNAFNRYWWDSFVRDNKLCFIGGQIGYLFIIDLDRNVLTHIPFESERALERIRLDGADYFLTCDIARKPHTAGNDGDYYNFCLYEFKNGELGLACTFPKEAEVSFADCGDGYINFLCNRAQTWGEDKNGNIIEVTKRRYNWRTYNYCVSTGKLIRGLKSIAHDKEKNAFVCGEYSFWVTFDTRGGLMSVTYCYYLNRRYGNKVEIMQYSLQGELGYNYGRFFDDIRAQ